MKREIPLQNGTLATSDLIKKYDVAGPRYTSYPTVPLWKETPLKEDWFQMYKTETLKHKEIAVYIHLPFCESLCTYCACNTRITVNHKVEDPYLQALIKEWKLYLSYNDDVKIKELHLGGGTPTFFAPENLNTLLSTLFADGHLAEDAELSFEGHPGNTTLDHITTLKALGFKRISLGIQDFDEEIQRIINRKQSYEDVARVVEQSRNNGYESINFDIVYGLPKQNLESIKDTIGKTIMLRPDRIAFYSYAHVPWTRPGQRAYDENDLPNGDDKRALYELGKKMLLEAGYQEIGMDHFALPTDSLYQAAANHKLHRNFMGYTTTDTPILVGLGASSISDLGVAYAQNVKKVEDYQHQINTEQIAFTNGHHCTPEEQKIRSYILDLTCHYRIKKDAYSLSRKERFTDFFEDGLLVEEEQYFVLTELGKTFIRNVAMALDPGLDGKALHQTFSRTI